MKILHVSSYGDIETCGIADYTRDLIGSLQNEEISQKVFTLPVSSYKEKDEKALNEIYGEIIKESEGFDIVHIQHEFSFFVIKKNYNLTLIAFFKFLRGLKSKKVFVTFHTDPLFYKSHPRKERSGLRKLVYKLKSKYQWKVLRYLCKKMGNEKGKYNCIVHNRLIKNSLLKLGFPKESLHITFLPVKIIKTKTYFPYLHETVSKLKKENDVLIGIVGFIDSYKGIMELLEALKLLPSNYKLILCGGQHSGGTSKFLNILLKKIHKTEQLLDRVLITGYLEEEHLHHCFNLIDIFAYPYHAGFTSSSAAIGLACQSGKPIITSKVETFKEIAKVYQCFELINCRNVCELMQAIKRINEDKGRSSNLVVNTKRFVTENSWEAAAHKFLNYYNAKC